MILALVQPAGRFRASIATRCHYPAVRPTEAFGVTRATNAATALPVVTSSGTDCSARARLAPTADRGTAGRAGSAVASRETPERFEVSGHAGTALRDARPTRPLQSLHGDAVARLILAGCPDDGDPVHGRYAGQSRAAAGLVRFDGGATTRHPLGRTLRGFFARRAVPPRQSSPNRRHLTRTQGIRNPGRCDLGRILGMGHQASRRSMMGHKDIRIG